jgi:hypothetical protein
MVAGKRRKPAPPNRTFVGKGRFTITVFQKVMVIVRWVRPALLAPVDGSHLLKITCLRTTLDWRGVYGESQT